MVEETTGSCSHYDEDSRDMEENSYRGKGCITHKHHFLFLERGVSAVLCNIIDSHSIICKRSASSALYARYIQLLRMTHV